MGGVGLGIGTAGGARPRRGSWVRPPRLRTADGEEHERHATALELFFDLVFVVAIAQLSHELVVDHGVGGFLRFGALFVPVDVAWQGFSIYADRFDTDDLVFRLAMFAAMLAIAAAGALVLPARVLPPVATVAILLLLLVVLAAIQGSFVRSGAPSLGEA